MAKIDEFHPKLYRWWCNLANLQLTHALNCLNVKIT